MPEHNPEFGTKLGATGRFPDGAINTEDDGELRFAVGERRGLVIVQFGTPVSWLAIPPAIAIELADALRQYANMAMASAAVSQQKP